MSGPLLLGLRLLAAIALYAFIAGALLLLWKSIQQQIRLLNQQKISSIELEIPMSEGSKEKNTYRFLIPEILIGRSQDCDLILDHGTVSAQHARLSFRQGQWWVEDWNSRNGTRLNEEILSTAAVLTNGDTISCGQAKILVKDQGANK